MTNFETYLSNCYDKGIIDHGIRSFVDDDGLVSFCIHPMGFEGEKLDFIVQGNDLKIDPVMYPELQEI